MSTFDTVRRLGSLQSGDGRAVEREEVGKVLEAGRMAPSPGNVQSLEFVVVESEEMKENLADCAGDRRMEDAGTVIVLVSDLDRMKRRAADRCENMCAGEAACAAQNMRLVAEEQGLASCWVTGIDAERVSGLLKIPEGKMPEGMVLLCESGTETQPEEKFELNEIAFYEEYGNQIESQFDGLQWKGLGTSRKSRRNREGLLSRLLGEG